MCQEKNLAYSNRLKDNTLLVGILLTITSSLFTKMFSSVSLPREAKEQFPQTTSLAALIRSVLGRTGLDPEVLSRFSSSQWAGLRPPHFGQQGILLTQGFSGHQTLILGINKLFGRKAYLTW